MAGKEPRCDVGKVEESLLEIKNERLGIHVGRCPFIE
jgi:hypothetical protein